jgi:hypothetical protein
MAGHGSLAIQAGVRPDALEALRDGREQDLTEDERQLVEFTRAVRDGKVTQAIWLRMVERLGSERGAIECAFVILLVLFNHLLASAMGVPDMASEELDALFAGFRSEGAAVSYHDYARTFGDAAFRVKDE